MNIKHSIKQHPKKWCVALVMLVALWCGRSFLPMMFLWGNGVTITLHVPENIEISDVSARYYSTNCRFYSLATGGWNYSLKDIDFKEKKTANNQYQAKVYFKDYSLCQWKLESFSWGIQYKNLKQEYPTQSLAKEYIGNGAGRSNYFFRFNKYLHDGSKANVTEEYKIVEHFYPTAKSYEKGFYVRLKSYDGQYSGEYGPQTKHINYTAIIDEKPQD